MTVDWNQIKSSFLAGETLEALSRKYSIPFSTLKSRHARENWSELRKKTEGKMQEKLTTEIANKQAEKALDAVKVIDETVDHLCRELVNSESHSKEALARAIAELLKVRGTYTGDTVQKNKTEVTYDVGELSRHLIEKIEAEQAEQEKQGINIYKLPNRPNSCE